MRTETLTVMVVDVVGSTQLVANASRDQLVSLMEDLMLPIRHIIHQYGGTVVKFTGDGSLNTFRSASDALRAAARVVEVFSEHTVLPSGSTLEGVRVALHTADLVVQDEDVLGEGVITAVRLEKHVPNNMVYLTNTVKDIAKTAEFEFAAVGEIMLRGLSDAVRVFRLITDPLSGIERGVYLCIVDLLGMSRFMTEAPIETVNLTLMRWVALQREATADYGGRLRAIVGDNLVTTFERAEDAIHALSELDQLLIEYNANRGDLPELRYSAIICKGDLFVLSFGVNGSLVHRAFRLLNQVPHAQKLIAAEVRHDSGLSDEHFALHGEIEGNIFYQIR